MQQRRSDRQLARRILAADERAFEEFFDRYYPRLFRFAVVRLHGDEETAQEVVQATLCRALDRLSSYRGESTLFAWLCSICRHLVIDHFRATSRHPVEPIDDRPEVRAVLESLSLASDPADRLERDEVSRLVHTTLDRLPGHYGRALEMRYLEGLAVGEIAAHLEIGYKAAESLLSRARAAFREGFQSVAAMALAEGGSLTEVQDG